jgi:hypothetical protein
METLVDAGPERQVSEHAKHTRHGGAQSHGKPSSRFVMAITYSTL